MDAAARSKAIKDATLNGVFNAGAYASNLEAEKTRQDAQNERMASKMTLFEKEEEVRWQAQQKAAKEKQKAEELQAGYAVYYAAMRQAEQEVKYGGPKVSAALALDDPPWWNKLIEVGKEAVDNAKEWVGDHVVQPAKETVNKAITTVKNFVTTTVTTAKETYQAVKSDIKQKVENAKQWVDIKVIQPVKEKWKEIVKFTNDVIDMAYPERKWQEFSESEKNQLLIELINSGELGRATAEYIVQEEVRLGYLPQPESGGGWTLSENLSFAPNTTLTDPRTVALTEHEVLHISSQNLATRFSVYGELQAWQLEYLAYYEITGKYYGQEPRPFALNTYYKWQELAQLSLDSREDLARAQILMKEISSSYRSNILPLEPAHKEIFYY